MKHPLGIVVIPWRQADVDCVFSHNQPRALAELESGSFEQDLAANNSISTRRRQHRPREWIAVYRDSSPAALRGLGRAARFYLAGHGRAGDGHLEAPLVPGAGNRLPRVNTLEIVRLFRMLGLSASYRGIITCDVCHSASHSRRGPPFAQQLATEFRRHGFMFLGVKGYVGEMLPVYQDTADAVRNFNIFQLPAAAQNPTKNRKYWHRHVRLADGQVDKAKNHARVFWAFAQNLSRTPFVPPGGTLV